MIAYSLRLYTCLIIDIIRIIQIIVQAAIQAIREDRHLPDFLQTPYREWHISPHKLKILHISANPLVD